MTDPAISPGAASGPGPEAGRAPAPGWPQRVLYLHGFRSSPQSAKARLVQARLAAASPGTLWRCPQLPASPAEALALILDLTADWPRGWDTVVMGSSLGGFYAVQAAHALQARVVLLNPAVSPERDLARHLGVQAQWHDATRNLDFRAEYLPELHAQQAMIERHGMRQRLTLTNAWALITQGDEVLDWREMASAHAGARCHVLPGGDHAISDFAAHWPLLEAFVRQAPPLEDGQGLGDTSASVASRAFAGGPRVPAPETTALPPCD